MVIQFTAPLYCRRVLFRHEYPSTTLGTEGATGMSEMHRVEIEFDDRCYQALVGEAERLHVAIEQVIARAAAAWVTEIAENAPTNTPTVTFVG
jgi:hypothetical protein